MIYVYFGGHFEYVNNGVAWGGGELTLKFFELPIDPYNYSRRNVLYTMFCIQEVLPAPRLL